MVIRCPRSLAARLLCPYAQECALTVDGNRGPRGNRVPTVVARVVPSRALQHPCPRDAPVPSMSGAVSDVVGGVVTLFMVAKGPIFNCAASAVLTHRPRLRCSSALRARNVVATVRAPPLLLNICLSFVTFVTVNNRCECGTVRRSAAAPGRFGPAFGARRRR